MDIKIALGKIDYGFLLSLLVVFIGFWIRIDDIIITNSIKGYSELRLFSYCFVHYICTVFILMILALFYVKGLLLINSELSFGNIYFTIIEYSLNMLFHNWLPLLILSLGIVIIAIEPVYWTFILVLPMCLLAISFMIRAYCSDYEASAAVTTFVLVGWGIYIIVMILISSEIFVQTDKQVYSRSEKVTIIITPKGYIFTPEINYLQINKNKKVGLENRTTNSLIINVQDIEISKFTINYNSPFFRKKINKNIELLISKSLNYN